MSIFKKLPLDLVNYILSYEERKFVLRNGKLMVKLNISKYADLLELLNKKSMVYRGSRYIRNSGTNYKFWDFYQVNFSNGKNLQYHMNYHGIPNKNVHIYAKQLRHNSIPLNILYAV
jgi:hypothetical protein